MNYAIKNFINSYPEFALNSQYAPVGSDINSTIAFHNYFEQIFPNVEIDVTLNLFYLNSHGVEVGNFSLQVPSNSSIQFDASKENIKSNGLVIIAAVPNKKIEKLKPANMKIKSKISTGFYIKWEGKNKTFDIMHEWSSVSLLPIEEKIYHIGILSKEYIKYGLILMNTIFDKKCLSFPRLRLMNRKREVFGEIKLGKIPSMGSIVVALNDIFPDIDFLLKKNSSLVIDLFAENLAPPLTVEWHTSGDFHIHHL